MAAAAEPPWHRLEFAAVTRRKAGGLTAYGYALFEDASNHLVATGCGPVSPSATFTQAVLLGLLQGFEVARARGARRMLLLSDSSVVVQQLQRASPATCGAQSPLAAALGGMSQLAATRVDKVDRWSNGLAIVQAEFASELQMLLARAATASPSKYGQVAGQLGVLLQLSMAERRTLESADDFGDTAAQLVALRCGTSKEHVLAAMRPQPTSASSSDVAGTGAGFDAAGPGMGTAAGTFTPGGSSAELGGPGSSDGDSGGGGSARGRRRRSASAAGATSSLEAAAASAAGGGAVPGAASSAAAAAAAPAGAAPRLVRYAMSRCFTPQEGAAYAAASASADVPGALPPGLDTGGGEVQEDEADTAADDAGHRLVGGRLVGRHRLTHRLLVVGLHKLPPDWEAPAAWEAVTAAAAAQQPPQPQLQPQPHAQQGPQQQQEQQEQQDQEQPVPSPPSPPQQRRRRRRLSEAPQAVSRDDGAQAAGGGAGGEAVEGLEDVLLPSWLPGSRAAGSSEAVGLGSERYSLPPVTSDTATHLLQFDGASRNNPGRGGYGWVLFDLTTGRLVGRGCMSLPYGQTAGRAEFEGLLAGLEAAQAAGVRHLAVQGDSALVLDALLYRRRVARDLAAAYSRASALLSCFDAVELQFIPRAANSLADRLASMSMDIDTALYALLRKDERGVAGLRVLTKAARMNKKQDVLELLMASYGLPLVAVVLLQRVMAITPAALLERLRDKAAHLGDPNPWLVQEVRQLAERGIPADVEAAVGSVVMDSRYKKDDLARLRRAAARAQAQAQAPDPAPPRLPPAPAAAAALAAQQRKFSCWALSGGQAHGLAQRRAPPQRPLAPQWRLLQPGHAALPPWQRGLCSGGGAAHGGGSGGSGRGAAALGGAAAATVCCRRGGWAGLLACEPPRADTAVLLRLRAALSRVRL
ncbi:hypothetical protein HT031_002483 [Scenedesmus sp. PABB004]|nr:hypothetical protein HT031_002483 [Scenedesmus sp. PABB004]